MTPTAPVRGPVDRIDRWLWACALADANYGQVLARRGITTVAVDADGQIVEHRSDGSSVLVTDR